MKAKNQKFRKGIILSAIVFLFCVIAGLFLLFWFMYRAHHVPRDPVRQADVAALSQGDYEGVLLSMYTAEAFDADEFMRFRGTSTVQAFHNFVNLADIGDYLDKCFASNENLSDVYIGFDPYMISGLYGYHTSFYTKDYEKYLTSYVQDHEDVLFELLIPVRSADYFRNLSDNEFTELLNSYRNLVNLYIPYDNVIIYYLSYEEWLIMNPEHFDGADFCKPDMLYNIVAYTFRDSMYYLTPNNMEKRFAQTAMLTWRHVSYPDLSDRCMVFFGDSVMAYYSGSLSIPGVVSALTGAETYNCGEKGIPAAENSLTDLSFNRMVSRFLEQDTDGLDADSNFGLGLTEYIRTSHEGKKVCFVIEFGLNDYFYGFPVDNPANQYDTDTYAGALRTGIQALQGAYPEAEILLLAPTYTAEFSGGTEINGAMSGTLVDYVNAAVYVAEEMGVYCLNNYAESGINEDTWVQYIADGTHPNESGSFLLGNVLIDFMERTLIDEE